MTPASDAWPPPSVSPSGGVLVTGVVSLQFVFQLPTVYGGNYAGCVYREVDVTGHLTVTNHRGDLVLTSSFGGGLTWASALFRY